jgi:hypothetical protein
MVNAFLLYLGNATKWRKIRAIVKRIVNFRSDLDRRKKRRQNGVFYEA